MPRVPTQIQTGAYGTTNPAAPTGRSLPQPSIPSRGPSQQRERFVGLPAPLARQLDRIQDAVAQAMAVVKRLPFSDGNLVQGVAFTGTTQKSIAHGLGRAWRGYMVVNVQNASGNAAFTATPNSVTDGATIHITPSVTCSCDVWIW